MTSSVTIRHNFETAHRLPFLAGKCENLHGHSWWATITVTADTDTDVVVEFGELKRAIRGWIDTNLDHGVMLGSADPLARILPDHGKTYVFGTAPLTQEVAVTTRSWLGEEINTRSTGPALDWPTVENVARLLARVTSYALVSIDAPYTVQVSRVDVTETHVNAATWERDQ